MDGRLVHASNKLEDAWALLRIIESAQDALAFKAAFAALLVACRSIPDAIDRELKPTLRSARKAPGGALRLADYERWRKAKMKERQESDGVIEFVETARDEDVHEGRHRLLFPSGQIGKALINTANGPPGTTGVVIHVDGAFYLVDTNTPTQRRVPVLEDITGLDPL